MDILEKYFQWLDKVVQMDSDGHFRKTVIRNVYETIHESLLIYMEDTLSDEFQILNELEQVIIKYARRHSENEDEMNEIGTAKRKTNDIDSLLEPLKKRMYGILRNPRARILRIHLSRDYGLRLRAAGENLNNGTLDGSEYHLLGYPCEVHLKEFPYHWAFEYETIVDLSPEKAELKRLLSGE